MRGVPRTEPVEHGTRHCYSLGPYGQGPGCRCDDCRSANRVYKSARERAIAYGTWSTYADAEPVRQHLLALRAAKIGRRQAAKLAGVHPSRLAKVLYGDSRDQPPPRQIRREIAEAILDVKPGVGPNPLVPVDSTGARRRLEALSARRWSPRAVAAEAKAAGLHLSPTTLRAIMRGEQITGSTRDDVQAVYHRLWDKAPPERTRQERIAAEHAARRAQDGGGLPGRVG